VVPVLNVLMIANVSRVIYHGRPLDAFLSSPSIAAYTFLFRAALFPNLITSSEGAAYSLTVSRAASGEMVMELILVVAALGMPFVLAYTAAVYWVFRGKVQFNPKSYRTTSRDRGSTNSRFQERCPIAPTVAPLSALATNRRSVCRKSL